MVIGRYHHRRRRRRRDIVAQHLARGPRSGYDISFSYSIIIISSLRSPGGPSSATLRVIARARVKSDTIPRSTSCSSSSRHRPLEFEGERYRRRRLQWSSPFFVFPLFSHFLLVLRFLFSLSHSSPHTHSLLTHHSLSLSLHLSHSLSSLDVHLVHRVCVFDLVRYLHCFFIQSHRAGVGNSSI